MASPPNGDGGPVAGTAAVSSAAAKQAELGPSLARRSDRTPQAAPTTPVVGSCWPILGGTGRIRYDVIYRCPAISCGGTHLAHVRGYVPARVERRLPCGSGTVVLLPVLKGSPAAVVA